MMTEKPLRTTIAAIVMSVLAVLLFAAIVVGGSRATRDWITPRTPVPSADTDVSPPFEVAERNRIRIMLNRRCGPDPEESADFDRMFCVALCPGSDDGARSFALLTLLDWNAVDFDPRELNRLVGLFRTAPIDSRIGLMRGLAADSEYGMTISELTADTGRLRQFLSGEKIQLE